MSFISGIFIEMIEKELSTQAPEIEAYLLTLLETFGTDLLAFVEKKMKLKAQTST